MSRSTLFMTHRTQAVRLPKPVAFPPDVEQVDIVSLGHSRLIIPRGRRWDDFFDRAAPVSDDFLTERAQPALEQREAL
ncbi:MAG TPA: type II toxin-antitoxin system VapB family antitoxin [Acetobacteraceae bacterium]|jgi:antitoxin VapB